VRRLQKVFTQIFRIDPRSIWQRYVVALSIILTLYVGGHFLSMSATNLVNSDASVGLLMSRQEALSQRILVNAQRLTLDSNDASARDTLHKLIERFDSAHHEILNGAGDPELKPENSDRLREVFYGSDTHTNSLNETVQMFVREARFIQVGNLGDERFTHERIEALSELNVIDKLEAATEAFHLDSADRGHLLHMVQVAMLLAGIFTIIFEACLIFWPAHIATRNSMTRLEDKSDELIEANEQLQESLREAQVARREADQSNGAKSMFLANMSHELRTPLNAIIGFSSMIRTEIFGPVGNARYKEYAHDIERSGTHLLELISDLMNLSQVEVGTAQMDPRSFHVDELMRDVKGIIDGWPMARRRDIAFIDNEDGDAYYGDPFRLRQIVLNLLSNAIKFTGDDARILVITRRTEAGGLQIIVEDTGRGFELEQISTLMQPFQRGDDAFTRSREGPGLGLALVTSFARMHGGEVSFSNAKAGGARVTVTLPGPDSVESAVKVAA